jgi:CBS domain containing-hemolysin-like protein
MDGGRQGMRGGDEHAPCPARIMLVVAPPLRAFCAVTKPVVSLLNGLGSLVMRPFGIPPAREVGHGPGAVACLRGASPARTVLTAGGRLTAAAASSS